MTPEETLPVLARWVAELRTHNQGLQRELEWQRAHNHRITQHNHRLRALNKLQANPRSRHYTGRP